MKYEDFCRTVKEKVTVYYEKQEKAVDVRIEQVQKNNGVVLDGIVIRDGLVNVSPTIYLNDFYRVYENGKDINKVVLSIIKFYEENKLDESMDVDYFMNFDRIRERIVYKVIHYEKNIKLLQDIPYMKFLDLAVVFYYIVSQNEEENATILLRNEYMKMWKVNREDVFRQAAVNTPKLLPAKIRTMEEVLLENYASRLEEENNPEFEEALAAVKQLSLQKESGMYVLTNILKFYGASCVLYRNVLKEFAEKLQKNLIILPSSVHEVILVPTLEKSEIEAFSKMVLDVNETQLMECEVLSNHVYYYDREIDEILIGD